MPDEKGTIQDIDSKTDIRLVKMKTKLLKVGYTYFQIVFIPTEIDKKINHWIRGTSYDKTDFITNLLNYALDMLNEEMKKKINKANDWSNPVVLFSLI